jgi:hypothetical protein
MYLLRKSLAVSVFGPAIGPIAENVVIIFAIMSNIDRGMKHIFFSAVKCIMLKCISRQDDMYKNDKLCTIKITFFLLLVSDYDVLWI